MIYRHLSSCLLEIGLNKVQTISWFSTMSLAVVGNFCQLGIGLDFNPHEGIILISTFCKWKSFLATIETPTRAPTHTLMSLIWKSRNSWGLIPSLLWLVCAEVFSHEYFATDYLVLTCLLALEEGMNKYFSDKHCIVQWKEWMFLSSWTQCSHRRSEVAFAMIAAIGFRVFMGLRGPGWGI